MILGKSVLRGRTLQTWFLDILPLGSIFSVGYLTVGLLTRIPEDQTYPSVLQYLSKIPRVDVLNGCGASSFALQSAEYLRMPGIDVDELEEDNVFDFEESFLVDRVRDCLHLTFRSCFRIPRSNLFERVNEQYILSVLNVIGKNSIQLHLYRP